MTPQELAPTPVERARVMAEIIRAQTYTYTDESSLHQQLEYALWERGLDVLMEHRLGPRERVDLMVYDVAVEVKVAGTSLEVTRQLRRYAAHPAVGALLLVTTVASHLPPTTLLGTPVVTVCLALGR